MKGKKKNFPGGRNILPLGIFLQRSNIFKPGIKKARKVGVLEVISLIGDHLPK
jgi:hypothetical protein